MYIEACLLHSPYFMTSAVLWTILYLCGVVGFSYLAIKRLKFYTVACMDIGCANLGFNCVYSYHRNDIHDIATTRRTLCHTHTPTHTHTQLNVKRELRLTIKITFQTRPCACEHVPTCRSCTCTVRNRSAIHTAILTCALFPVSPNGLL